MSFTTAHVQIHSRVARILLSPRAVAFTFGRRIYARAGLTERQLCHELAHVKQFRRYGIIGFLLRYFWFNLRYGYERNPLELEARLYADRVAAYEPQREERHGEDPDGTDPVADRPGDRGILQEAEGPEGP